MRIFFERSRTRQLAEVKAILHRLQDLAAEAGTPVPATSGGNTGYANRIPKRRVLAAALGLIAGLATIGLAAYTLTDLRGSAGQSPALRPTRSAEGPASPAARDRQPTDKSEPSAQAILEKATQDIAAGHVRAAREALIRIQHQGSADMAWTLARSYDPNFLNEIAQRDAEPNVTEAVRWYRIWYSRALTDGLVAETVSLERIIRSMPAEPAQSPTAK
jgi:hypothetical protein